MYRSASHIGIEPPIFVMRLSWTSPFGHETLHHSVEWNKAELFHRTHQWDCLTFHFKESILVVLESLNRETDRDGCNRAYWWGAGIAEGLLFAWRGTLLSFLFSPRSIHPVMDPLLRSSCFMPHFSLPHPSPLHKSFFPSYVFPFYTRNMRRYMRHRHHPMFNCSNQDAYKGGIT